MNTNYARVAAFALATFALATFALLPAAAAPKKMPPKKMPPKAAPTAVGDWRGTLNAGGTSLRLVLHFVRTSGGTLGGSVDSLDQGANGIPFSLVRQTGPTLHAESAVIHATYDATLDPAGKTLTGEWSQGMQMPLTLTRMTAAMKAEAAPNDRPQEPKPPYPYAVQDVTFPGGAPGVTLAGTLTLPSGPGPFPAAVLIAGSGPNDRDETILRHHLFLVLADSLTRRGLAVLRYDKRGIGKSTGPYAQATSADFAADASAAAAYLKTVPAVNAKKIGLIGHSEGGLIAPMVAAKSPDIAFLVLLAGTGVPGSRILAEQGDLIGKAEGMSAAEVKMTGALRSDLITLAAQETDPAVATAKMTARLREAVAALPPAKKKEIGPPEGFVKRQAAFMASPWMHYFLTYDPAPALRSVRCPVLALDGSHDLQVPPAENLAAISAALKAGGNPDVTASELPGLNHLFQTAKTGAPSEYGRIEETMAPAALTVIGDWVVARR